MLKDCVLSIKVDANTLKYCVGGRCPLVDVNTLRYCAEGTCPLYTGGCEYIEILCWRKLSSLYRWM